MRRSVYLRAEALVIAEVQKVGGITLQVRLCSLVNTWALASSVCTLCVLSEESGSPAETCWPARADVSVNARLLSASP